MRIVAMLTPAQARRGSTFRVVLHPSCRQCMHYKVCVSKLRSGGRYRVVEVRGVAHKCPLIGEKMRVVVVEPAPMPAAVDSKLAVEGVISAYHPVACGESRCKYYNYCHAAPLAEGDRIKITSVRGRLACPRGLPLTLVEVIPLEEPST